MPDGMRVTLLGTGTSTGVPVIGCDCPVCRSPDPRDKRTRCSALVEWAGVSILVDVGPDFRAQALREEIQGVDAVLFTHHHFDHVVGIDDLRPFLFRNRSAIPCFAPVETEKVLRGMFAYIFEDGSYPGVANLTLQEITPEPFTVASRSDPAEERRVVPIPLLHGDSEVYGYRFGPFAYLTDTNHIPKESYDRLQGVEILVLDALRRRPHGTHFSFDEAVEAATAIGARETYFVHMTHSVLHEAEEAALPENMHLAFDGLKIEL